MNVVSMIFSYLIPTIGVLSFIKAIVEWKKSQVWKESEFLSKECKEFFNDSDIKKVLLLLDWNARELELKEGLILIDDNFLKEALKTHDEKQKFTKTEAEIRDLFDHFFDKLSFFNIYQKNGLVSQNQIHNYFRYYLEILSSTKRKPDNLMKVIWNYIDYYGYVEVREMINNFKD